VITYKGHSISAEFAGIGKPDRFCARRLSACSTVGIALLGSFESEGAARAAIDALEHTTRIETETRGEAEYERARAEGK
jgi:hypothetical protein